MKINRRFVTVDAAQVRRRALFPSNCVYPLLEMNVKESAPAVGVFLINFYLLTFIGFFPFFLFFFFFVLFTTVTKKKKEKKGLLLGTKEFQFYQISFPAEIKVPWKAVPLTFRTRTFAIRREYMVITMILTLFRYTSTHFVTLAIICTDFTEMYLGCFLFLILNNYG